MHLRVDLPFEVRRSGGFGGAGWVWAAGGVLMGLVYELGHDIPSTLPNFGQGTPLAEFLWGVWLWKLYGAVVLGTRQGPVGADDEDNAVPARGVPLLSLELAPAADVVVVGEGPGAPLLMMLSDDGRGVHHVAPRAPAPTPSPVDGAMALARGVLKAAEVLILVVGIPTVVFTAWWAAHHP